tara:strand:- start:12175 stop:12609 length:435 start_codon:yes stop_codon:yes gene_type:complete
LVRASRKGRRELQAEKAARKKLEHEEAVARQTKRLARKASAPDPLGFIEYTIDRKHAEIMATPRWVDFDALKCIILDAAALSLKTGVKHSVDHRIPLRHPLVCGLNVPWNLQILTVGDNSRKGNNFDTETADVSMILARPLDQL